MPWLVDGSNVLGAMRVDRHDDRAKRELVRLLAGFARAKRTRVTCVFDGPEPASFGKHLGSVTVVFSGGRSADEVIVERASTGRGWSVATSDRELAARVQRREVTVVQATAMLREIEASASGEEGGEVDWADYFADQGNRMKF
jgi:predicted RNA-binding protein with PIN domain